MENNNILDPNDEVHLSVLHRIYLPIINKALKEFEHYWEFHPLSSAGNKSPRQLWFIGIQNTMENDPNSLYDAQIGRAYVSSSKMHDGFIID